MQAGILVEAYAGTQKCLSAPPGLAPITFTNRAVAAVKARKAPIQSWFLDLGLMLGYWEGEGARSYHHTAPVNVLYGLHESLTRLLGEGLETAWARHRSAHDRLVERLEGSRLRRRQGAPAAAAEYGLAPGMRGGRARLQTPARRIQDRGRRRTRAARGAHLANRTDGRDLSIENVDRLVRAIAAVLP
jgi:alanine-glyoxylate transaminase/serine-glyoxylate transaminase/serine-pyruvate transaminase